MPKTKVQNNVPNYDIWKRKIRGLMAENQITTRTAGPKSNASYSRWLSDPWKFNIYNLSVFLRNLHLSMEEEESLILMLYRGVRKK